MRRSKKRKSLQYGTEWKRIASHLSVFHHTRAQQQQQDFLQYSRHFLWMRMMKTVEGDGGRGEKEWGNHGKMEEDDVYKKGMKTKKNRPNDIQLFFRAYFGIPRLKCLVMTRFFPFYLSALLSFYIGDQIYINSIRFSLEILRRLNLNNSH